MGQIPGTEADEPLPESTEGESPEKYDEPPEETVPDGPLGADTPQDDDPME